MLVQQVVSLLHGPQNTEDWVILQVDIANAFNTLQRTPMLLNAAARTPHLMPWLSTLYGNHLPLLVKGGEGPPLWSQQGPQQGCTFGTLLFAMGIQDDITNLPDLWVNMWYADDGTLIGPTQAVEAAARQLRSSLSAKGLTLNLQKSVVWGPGLPREPPADMLLGQMRRVPFLPGSGIVVLGTPVHHPAGEPTFLREFWAAKATETRALLSKIAALGHCQFEHALIRSTADVCRINHLLRSTCTTPVTDVLSTIQDHLAQAVHDMLGRHLSPDQLTQAFLPTRFGGLGIKNPRDYQPAARLSAIASFASDFLRAHTSLPRQLLRELPADTGPCLATLRSLLGEEVQPLKDWASDPARLFRASSKEAAQQAWQERLAVTRRRTFLTVGTHRDLCRKALQTSTAGAWLSSLPNATETEFEHCDYKVALQWWLGLPLIPPSETGNQCSQCGSCLDAWGDHAVTCRMNRLTERHTSLQDWLLSTARTSGLTCTREGSLDDESRPADVLLHNWGGKGPLAVDLTCVHPLRPSESRPTPETVKKMLLREQENKITKYRTKCAEAGWAFQPLVIHPFAGLTSDGNVFLNRLARLYAENTSHLGSKSERVQAFWQSFTCTTLRFIAAQLRLTTLTGQHRIMLAVPHDSGNTGELPTSWRGSAPTKRPRASSSSRRGRDTTHSPYD